jgi:hypothetical protein
MTTHTTLSGSVAQALLPVRFCHGTYKKPPHLALSLTIDFLIANLELEFRLTHRKLSPLNISNRKYSAIFYPGFRAHSPLTSSKQDSPPAFLIATFTNSRIESSNCKQTRKQNPNRNKTAVSAPTQRQNFEVGTRILRWILHLLFGYARRPFCRGQSSEGRGRKN